MKISLLCPLALLIFAGCNREPEPEAVVVLPSPTAVTIIKVAPTVAPQNKVIIVPAPAKPKVIVVTPPQKETVIIEKPAPIARPIAKPTAKPVVKPAAKPIAKPAVKPKVKPTAKPIVKPAARPKVKPITKPAAKATAKPIAKPKPTPVAALMQPAPTLVVRAVVVSTSKVPDPSTVAYSDALVFSKYRVVAVEKGAYEPSEILVAQWGMKGKKLTSAARLRAGDAAKLELVPLDAMPKLERIMRNDDTGDYDSTPYFALEK